MTDRLTSTGVPFIYARTCVRMLDMEKRKHYWNGLWGRLARHDVLLFEDGGEWTIEDRRGGAEGRSRWFQHDSEEGALERVRALMAGRDDWREL